MMTEEFSSGRCRTCGTAVGIEDGMRQDFCECDPWCESCGRQFRSECSKRICDDCLEEEIAKEFSEEFLKTLSGKQFSLLLKDVARRFG